MGKATIFDKIEDKMAWLEYLYFYDKVETIKARAKKILAQAKGLLE